jgi:RNA-directed DNA polymerase
MFTVSNNSLEETRANCTNKTLICFPEDLNKLYPFGQETQSHLVRAQALKLFCFYSSKLSKASTKTQKVFSEEKLYNIILQYQFYLDGCQSFVKYKNPKFLHKLLFNPAFLLLVYFKLKSSSVFLLAEVLKENLTLEVIRRISAELQNELYKCLPVRCVYSRKFKINNTQFLGISSSKDKLVQMALRMLLEPLFEPRFYDVSYGFRPGKNCHTCLREILLNERDVTWFIDMSLPQVFSHINYKLLLCEIESILKDFRVIDLLQKMLKVGYITVTRLTDSKLESGEKTLQGMVLSYFIVNVFFHRLDKFVVDQIIPHYNEPKKSTYNRKYWKAIQYYTMKPWVNLYFEAKKLAPNVSLKKIKKSFVEICKQDVGHKRISSEILLSRSLWYLRYADDTLFGFCGTKQDAVCIMQHLAIAIERELCMSINPKKSVVRHHSEGVVFLGYQLMGHSRAKYRWDIKCKNMLALNYIKFSVPIFRLLSRLKEKGFIQRGKKKKNVMFVARKVDKWLFLPSDYMVLQKFNEITRGLANYYVGSCCFVSLIEVYYLLKRSAALTLAHRHKKRTAKWAFEKWGKELVVQKVRLNKRKEQLKTIRFLIPSKKNFIISGRWQANKTGVLEILMNTLKAKGIYWPMTSSNIVTKKKETCSIPNCPNLAEVWHTVKYKKKYKKELESLIKFEVEKTDLYSKRIPVCEKHHFQISSGRYGGPSLKKLSGYLI